MGKNSRFFTKSTSTFLVESAFSYATVYTKLASIISLWYDQIWITRFFSIICERGYRCSSKICEYWFLKECLGEILAQVVSALLCSCNAIKSCSNIKNTKKKKKTVKATLVGRLLYSCWLLSREILIWILYLDRIRKLLQFSKLLHELVLFALYLYGWWLLAF